MKDKKPIIFVNIEGEELPESINRIANERYDPSFRKRNPASNRLKLKYGFKWNDTPEKQGIWDKVDDGEYDMFYEFHNITREGSRMK
jgi:hypothetical protein